MPAWLMLSVAFVALAASFAALFLVCRRLNNYGFVDVAWSYAFGLLALFYACAGPGWAPRKILLGAMAGVWSLRLGTHLLRRVAAHHPVEDGRYAQLRQGWAENFGPKMFGFFQAQALSVLVLGVPFLLPMFNGTPAFHPWEFAGAALWVIAVAGETLADAQLAAFKRAPGHRGRVCDTGLWRYSRHPNYFFEWLTWVAYFAFALGSPRGWIAVIGPAAILYLLLRVTGIPLAEQQSLRSKGDAYRRYQRVTSAFVPLPPRSSP